jgi:hypothetical protein
MSFEGQMQFDQLKRRDFIPFLGGAGVWPVWARAAAGELHDRVSRAQIA